jgi:hypothetical protein
MALVNLWNAFGAKNHDPPSQITPSNTIALPSGDENHNIIINEYKHTYRHYSWSIISWCKFQEFSTIKAKA